MSEWIDREKKQTQLYVAFRIFWFYLTFNFTGDPIEMDGLNGI